MSLRTAIDRLRQIHRSSSRQGFWEERVRRYGFRAVFNVQHGEAELEQVTRTQKERMYPHFRRLLNGQETLTLDFGCGPGRFTLDIAEMTGGRVVGLDPVAELIRMAPPHPAVEYRVYGGRKIPFPDESIDAVWICLVLGGIEDEVLSLTIADILRVVKSGGLIFLVENTCDKPSAPHWTFRSVEAYQRLFLPATLDCLDEYEDMGERISIMAGRRP